MILLAARAAGHCWMPQALATSDVFGRNGFILLPQEVPEGPMQRISLRAARLVRCQPGGRNLCKVQALKATKVFLNPPLYRRETLWRLKPV